MSDADGVEAGSIGEENGICGVLVESWEGWVDATSWFATGTVGAAETGAAWGTAISRPRTPCKGDEQIHENAEFFRDGFRIGFGAAFGDVGGAGDQGLLNFGVELAALPWSWRGQ
jgi:hypothetical protein